MEVPVKCVLEIMHEDAEILKKCIEVESKEEFFFRTEAKNGRLLITLKTSRLSVLQAGVNSYLRLLKTVVG